MFSGLFRSSKPAALCLLALFSSAAIAKADTFTFTGNTEGESPQWNRPTVNQSPGMTLAVAGGGQGWVAEEFTVGTSGTYDFSVQATGPGTGEWDDGKTYNILGFLYANNFVYTNSLANLVADGGDSQSFNLTAGTDYFIVVSGYCGTGTGSGKSTGPPSDTQDNCTGPSTLEEGPFSASISGPGAITAVTQTGTNVGTTPEPESLLLVITGLTGSAGFIRNRRKNGANR